MTARTSGRDVALLVFFSISEWLGASDTWGAFGARDNDILKETAFK